MLSLLTTCRSWQLYYISMLYWLFVVTVFCRLFDIKYDNVANCLDKVLTTWKLNQPIKVPPKVPEKSLKPSFSDIQWCLCPLFLRFLPRKLAFDVVEQETMRLRVRCKYVLNKIYRHSNVCFDRSLLYKDMSYHFLNVKHNFLVLEVKIKTHNLLLRTFLQHNVCKFYLYSYLFLL